jgi:hypothetical protein
MSKRSRKKPLEKGTQKLARHILDSVMPDAEPTKAKKNAKHSKDPAAIALGRKGGPTIRVSHWRVAFIDRSATAA